MKQDLPDMSVSAVVLCCQYIVPRVVLPEASCVQSPGSAVANAKLELAKLEERRTKICNLIVQEKQVKPDIELGIAAFYK